MGDTQSPLVSVIIPTYNRATLLEPTLDSVFAQTYPHIEVIVADDGSTDDTTAMLSRYGDRVRHLALTHTGLPASARNAALAAAKGDFIAFLDSDDLWQPEKLARQVAVLEAQPEVGLVCTDALILHDGRGIPRERYLHPGQGASGHVLPLLLRDNFVINSSVMVRRVLLARTGPLCEEPAIRALDDYDLWLRLAALVEVAYLDEPLTIYRDGPASIRAEQPPVAYWQGRLCVVERLEAFLRAQGLLTSELASGLNIVTADLLLGLAAACRHAGDAAGARRAWGRLLRVRPRTFAKQLASRLRRRQATPAPALRQPEATGGLRLHLGCGERHFDGYLNIDFPPEEHTVQHFAAADEYADITRLHYSPESVDEIRLHHVFEHFDRPTALRLLMDWYDWLRAGGLLTIEVPDFTRCVAAMRGRPVEAQQVTMRHIFGSHEAFWAVHADGWYREKLGMTLTALGFRELTFTTAQWRDTYNITVQAMKRVPYMTRDEQFRACERLLRLSLVDETENAMLACWLAKLRGGEDAP